MECVGCGETMERVGEGWECPDCGLCLFEFDNEYDDFNPDKTLPQRIEANYDFETGSFIPAKWINIEHEEADSDDVED